MSKVFLATSKVTVDGVELKPGDTIMLNKLEDFELCNLKQRIKEESLGAFCASMKKEMNEIFVSTTVGRFQCSEPNITSLPKDYSVNYENLELRTMMFVPNDLGGYDSVDLERPLGASPVLGMPFAHDVFERKYALPGEAFRECVDRIARHIHLQPPVDAHKQCPKCVVDWKESPGLCINYYDCPSCGAKKEDYAR